MLVKLNLTTHKLLDLMEASPICLASGSLSRQVVLSGVKFRYSVLPADIDETNLNEKVEDYVLRLSKEKALSVSKNNQSKIIVAADSVAELKGEILGKPSSKNEAIRILAKLTGNWHTFVTGLCVIRTSDMKIKQMIVKTKVKLSEVSETDLELYVDTIKPFGYAGGFSNSESSWFIEKIEGSISNLMGLPMNELYTIVKEFGFTLSDFY